VVCVVVIVGWESSSVDVIVCLWSSTSVQVKLWGAVGIEWVEESLGGVLVSLRLFNRGGVAPVILLEHLLVDDIIIIVLSLDHSSLWFEIWSGIVLILKMICWHVVVAS